MSLCRRGANGHPTLPKNPVRKEFLALIMGREPFEIGITQCSRDCARGESLAESDVGEGFEIGMKNNPSVLVLSRVIAHSSTRPEHSHISRESDSTQSAGLEEGDLQETSALPIRWTAPRDRTSLLRWSLVGTLRSAVRSSMASAVRSMLHAASTWSRESNHDTCGI